MWKAERYWLGKEDPAEMRTESQLVAEIDLMQKPKTAVETEEKG